MSGSALPQIQDAVRTALSTDSALAALVTGVFDQVPPSQPYPYIALGEKSETEFSTFARGGSRATLALEVRSQAAESTELLNVYDRVREVLQGQPLAVAGYTVLFGTLVLLKTTLDPDGVTRLGQARFEVVVQEEEPVQDEVIVQ